MSIVHYPLKRASLTLPKRVTDPPRKLHDVFFRALSRWEDAGGRTRQLAPTAFAIPTLSRWTLPADWVSALSLPPFSFHLSFAGERGDSPLPALLFTINFILTIFSGNLSSRSLPRFVCFASAKIITINRICKKNSNFFTENFYPRVKQSITIIFQLRPCPSLHYAPIQVTPHADSGNPTHRLR